MATPLASLTKQIKGDFSQFAELINCILSFEWI
jgi:hypothetical protein